MRTTQRHAWFVLGVVLSAAPVVGVLLVAGLPVRVSIAPARPAVPLGPLPPPLVAAAIWARFGGGVDQRVDPLTVWGFAALRWCRFQAAGADDRQQQAEQCLATQVGLPLAASIAARHVRDEGQSQSVAARELGQVATAGWLTRSWDADSLVRDLAQRGDFDVGGRGVEDAARRYFDKTPAALTAAGAATLAAALPGAERWQAGVSPWCAPTAATAARNRVLRRMAANGAVDAGELQVMMQSPLGVLDRGCR